jgi:hypothetical protein
MCAFHQVAVLSSDNKIRDSQRENRKSRMPARTRPLWLLTVTLIGLFPLLNFIYWPEVLRSGVLSPDADSIGIPIYGSILLTLIASPFILGIAWLCLRRYNPATRLAALRWDRPFRTVTATLVFGGAAALCVFIAVVEVGDNLPWYEHLWTGYALAWVPWLLAVRAAAIDQGSVEKD